MPIHYEKNDDHVVLITIDRPEARCSLDLPHFGQLADAWRSFRDDPDAWVAIITGVGDSFCVGADLKTFIPMVSGPHQEDIRSGKLTEIDGVPLTDSTFAVLRNVELYKPIIAAVNGTCVAGGMEMLGGIDIAIACPEATFGVLEPKRGLFAGGGTTVRLPRQLPFRMAMEFLLTADRIPAQRAYEMGLINEIVPRERLIERAYEWAARINANAPIAVQATKESVLRGRLTTMDEAYRIEQRIGSKVFRTEDAQEGPRAFAEKRAPVWKGR
jgi:enoyl-CoA hydratase/carnithine racemase